MNLLRKKVSKGTLFSEYTKILNGVLQLSPREAEVFSFILQKDSTGSSLNINTKEIRTEIIKTYNISEANLSRYLGVIKEKGLIIRGQTGKWVVNDLVRPIVKDNVFELKFVLEIE
jgi:DNA-binding MarR family transcriptional regulator